MEQIEKQIEMVNHRLDDMDSVVTNLVERVMKQPVTIEMNCPKCGTTIQILLTSSVKTVSKSKEDKY
jgi:hypothetical protein